MYEIINGKKIVEGLGVVSSFLGELQDKLLTNFDEIHNTYLVLKYDADTRYYKVGFSIDDREEYTQDIEVRDFISNSFSRLRDIDWVRETSYQDGTAGYNLFFKIKKENK